MEKWVFHEKYGKGIVVKTRYLGFEQFIKFSNGIEKWILSSKLKSIESSTQANIDNIIGDKADISIPNVPLYPRSHKPVISFDEPVKTKSEEYSDISIPNVPLYPRSHKSVISFDEPVKTKSEEYSDISIPNVPLYPRSHKSVISFDEPVKTENIEQKNIVSAAEIPDINHPLESEIHLDEPVKTENIEQKNIVSAAEIPDINHPLESEIHLDEPVKTENIEQKNIVSAAEIPDINHPLESEIHFDEPVKTENIEQWNVVPRNDIQFLDDSCSTLSKNKDNVSSRMIIEALRLGGVFHEQAEVFAYGRKREIYDIKKWLMSKDGCLLMSGEYGVGKTHLLEIISSMAIKDGWAVARIEIDPDESPLHKPKRIYDHFVRSLSYKQSDKLLGFQDFIISIAESNNSERKERLLKHPYLGKVLTHWDDEEDRSWLLDWIKGDGSKPANFPQMFDTQTTANIYCNILSGLGWSAKNILGLKGIIILFDEAECVDAGWYTLYQFDKALRFLKGIILTSNNDERLLKDYTSFYASGELGLGYYGGSRKQYRYPYLWERESCLKLIFSFVPDMLDSMLNYQKIYDIISELPSIKIDTLDEHDLQNVLEKVIDVYENAYYDFTFKYDICDIYPYLSRNKTRIFLKGAVEYLDIMRFNPEMQLNEILDYAE